MVAYLAMAAGMSPVAWGGERSLREAWTSVIRLQFPEALHQFERPGRIDGRTRELGQAAVLLNLSPVTEERVALAVEKLRRLIRGDAHDEAGIAARYLLARAMQLHLTPPDRAEAMRLYRELFREQSQHLLGQMAAVHLASLLIYDPAADSLPLARLSEVESWEKTLIHPDAAKACHLVLAEAYLFFDLDRSRCLYHLRAAFQLGVVIPQERATLLMRMGRLAQELGDQSLAATSYTLFLKENPGDERCYMIEQFLKQIQAASAKGGP